MKKILGILLLAMLLIFSAGCITEEEPAYAGTWTQTGQYDEKTTVEYTLTLNPDGSGLVVYDYSDGDKTIHQVQWVKDGENSLAVEKIFSVTLNEDGSMTDLTGRTYQKIEGKEGLIGLWSETLGVYDNTYLFKEDGTGMETRYTATGERYEYPFIWRTDSDNENLILYWDTYTYRSTEGGIIVADTWLYEKIKDGVFVSQGDGYTDTFTFAGVEWCVRTVRDNGETYVYHYNQIENKKLGFQIVSGGLFGYRPLATTIEEGVLIGIQLCNYDIEENGDLICQNHGEKLTKTL